VQTVDSYKVKRVLIKPIEISKKEKDKFESKYQIKVIEEEIDHNEFDLDQRDGDYNDDNFKNAD